MLIRSSLSSLVGMHTITIISLGKDLCGAKMGHPCFDESTHASLEHFNLCFG